MSALAPGLQHLLLALAWLAYGLIHSLLASLRFKAWVEARWPQAPVYYRLSYNLTALVLLLPVAWVWAQVEAEPLWRWQGAWAWLANGLALAALVGFVHASRYYDTDDFLGLRQWRRQPPRAHTEFTLSPWHRHVRHPWYFLGLVILWTRDMDSALLVTALMLTLYLWLGSRLEERKLIQLIGPRYARYCQRVPGLIPRPWRSLSRDEADALCRDEAES